MCIVVRVRLTDGQRRERESCSSFAKLQIPSQIFTFLVLGRSIDST